ncbi:MAG: insulinase family protein, partial [Myxococcales bacterium]|nr:insulinase family protein [Myxococcales bacterium]
MRGIPWFALSLTLTSCSATGRLAAPLRYDPDPAEISSHGVEERDPKVPPPVRSEGPLVCPSPRIGALENGMRLIVVERRSFPSVAVRLVFPSDAPPWDPSVWSRMTLLGDTFLQPEEAGEYASASCTRIGCTATAFGTRHDLDSLLERLAELVVAPREQRAARARRFEASLAALGSPRTASVVLGRSTFAMLFGESPVGDAPATEYTLEDVERTRESVLRPDRATLVFAGDLSFEDAAASARRWFGT